MKTKIAAIIPARMASTRFPGKPLFEIDGLPMIEHVRRRTLLCKNFSDVVVATCDVEIQKAVEAFGGKVVMTSSKHEVATERIIETMERLDCTHVVNVQGDEILILPHDLEKIIDAIHENPEGKMWNAVAKLGSAEELRDPSIVKCALSRSNQFLFCARDFSNLPFSAGGFEPLYWVIGILAYSRSFLERFSDLPGTPLEEKLSIEQMRVLENGIPITAVHFEKAYPGINEPREVTLVQRYLKEDLLQKQILQTILEKVS